MSNKGIALAWVSCGSRRVTERDAWRPLAGGRFTSAFSYRGVKNILEAGLDRVQPEDLAPRAEKPHPNIRGRRYYS